MNIEKFAISSLAPQLREGSEGLSLDWNKATRSTRSIGVQKLHWWIATNGATISGEHATRAAAQGQGQGQGQGGAEGNGTPKRRGSRESNISFEEWQRALSDTGSGGDMASGGSGVTPADGDDDDDALSIPAEVVEISAEGKEGEQQYQSPLSLSSFYSDLFRSRKEQAGSPTSEVKLFGIPAQSRIHLIMQARVPLVESQSLKVALKIKNLATSLVALGPHSIDRYQFDINGGVLVADEHTFSVALQVDATKALELIAAIDEPLIAKAQQEGIAAADGAQSLVRMLKDPFIVPPPAELTLVGSAEESQSGVEWHAQLQQQLQTMQQAMKIQAKSKGTKTHCRFSVKNKLSENVRVSATAELSPEVSGLIDIKVKFQTNNSDAIELVPEESTAVKVRMVPKFSGRLGSSTLSAVVRVAEESTSTSNTMNSSNVSASAEDVMQDSVAVGIAAAAESSDEYTPHPASALGVRAQNVTSPSFPTAPILPVPVSVPEGKRSASGGTSTATGTVNAPQPILIGSVRLTPQEITNSDQDNTAVSISSLIRESDVIIVDLYGFINAGPTVAAITTLPAPAVPASVQVPVEEVINPLVQQGSTSQLSVPVSAGATATTGATGAGVPSVLEFRAVEAEADVESDSNIAASTRVEASARPSDSSSLPAEATNAISTATPQKDASIPNNTGNVNNIGGAGGGGATQLRLSRDELNFFIANPATTSSLNYEVRTQVYRHAGLRLLLPHSHSRSHSTSTNNNTSSDTEGFSANRSSRMEAYDTFTLEAFPATGCLEPSSLASISLRLVPGDPSSAIKAATTLTSDIPDVQMRERRLRSHHKDPPNSNITAISSSMTSAPSRLTIVTSTEGSDAALVSSSSASTSLPAVGAPSASAVITSRTGPFTIACMQIEVWDRDNMAHPPRILCAYLTSEVALSVISTQSVREASSVRNTMIPAAAPVKRSLSRIPSEAAGDSSGFEPIAATAPFAITDSAVARSFEVASPHGVERTREKDTCAEEVTLLFGQQSSSRSSSGSSSSVRGSSEICTLQAGVHTQRKESLEWTVCLENVSERVIHYSITPVVTEDTDAWLGLGQSGGVLPAKGRSSFMVYARRAIALGTYVSYILVTDLHNKIDCHVLKVCMEIAAEQKRPAPVHLTSSASTSLFTTNKSTTRSDDNLQLMESAAVGSGAFKGFTTPFDGSSNSSEVIERQRSLGVSGNDNKLDDRPFPSLSSSKALAFSADADDRQLPQESAAGAPKLPSPTRLIISSVGIGGGYWTSAADLPAASVSASGVIGAGTSANKKALFRVNLLSQAEGCWISPTASAGLSLSPIPSPSDTNGKHWVMKGKAQAQNQSSSAAAPVVPSLSVTLESVADIQLIVNALCCCHSSIINNNNNSSNSSDDFVVTRADDGWQQIQQQCSVASETGSNEITIPLDPRCLVPLVIRRATPPASSSAATLLASPAKPILHLRPSAVAGTTATVTVTATEGNNSISMSDSSEYCWSQKKEKVLGQLVLSAHMFPDQTQIFDVVEVE